MAITDHLPVVPLINPAQHAVLDYGVATMFFGLAMRFRGRHPAAAGLAFANGAMVLGMSLLTKYPGGVWPRISFKTHGVLDLVQAALTGFGPLMLGFEDDPEARTFYAQAVSEIGVVATTDWNDPTVA